ncbi:hypothetical protein Poly24_54960 [Rosistilla carotiformis]|uniref:DUF3892 domain-containing protein n=1 Tax=Rosistilla carotiformis TaxID=2528017 RepID=A0A518K1R6_9BACT|nr:DUF3892 domain-containing protein [Rosistilla carotiformis]QDV71756.1 hypothetical protein Poly24_54960 [Rosistilla carotiformis]
MTTSIRIKFIVKSEQMKPHLRISHVGGTSETSARWYVPVEEAIRDIECGKCRFFVLINGLAIWVVVAVDAAGVKYLKTQADSDTVSHLLSLPDCNRDTVGS